MTGRQAAPSRDPLDVAAPPLLSATANSATERWLARATVCSHATNPADEQQLLAALGLDHTASLEGTE